MHRLTWVHRRAPIQTWLTFFETHTQRSRHWRHALVRLTKRETQCHMRRYQRSVRYPRRGQCPDTVLLCVGGWKGDYKQKLLHS